MDRRAFPPPATRSVPVSLPSPDVRPPQPGDEAALLAFFKRVPEQDRNFFKENVLDARILRAWVKDRRARRLLAWEGSRIIAYCAVIPSTGWSSHVGEVRLVVDPSRRRRGLGRRLARMALVESVRMGLQKVSVELIADQELAIAMFQDIGFVGEALLRDHVRDRRHQLRDLVVLSHNVADNVDAFETAGLRQG